MGYKSEFVANPNISTKGYGKPGWCALCSLSDEFRKPLTRLFREDQKAPAINEWLTRNVGKPFDRRVIYNHREHVRHPRDRVVNAVQRQQAKGTLPASVTEEEYMDAVLAAAMQRVIDDPESVTIDQGIKVATAKAAAKASRGGAQVTLQIALTRPLEGTPALLIGDGSIEGDYSEVP